MNNPHRTRAVTLIGLLIALGLFAAIVCGLLWIGAQVLDKAETISGRYEERLTNEMKFSLVAEADPVLERLYELPDTVLLPSTNVVMTDEEFLAWSDSLVTYAVLYAHTLDGAPWLDTGERLTGDHGEWDRVLGDSPTTKHGLTGVLLDPPYASEERDAGLYSADTDPSAAVREWAVANGDNPLLRIALCGYDGEHTMPQDWERVAWKARGGYGSQPNAKRERIWFSPHCLKPDLFWQTPQPQEL